MNWTDNDDRAPAVFGVILPRVFRRFLSSAARMALMWLAGFCAKRLGIELFTGVDEPGELAEELTDWALVIGIPVAVAWWSARRAKRTEKTIEVARFSNPGTPRVLIDNAVKRDEFSAQVR